MNRLDKALNANHVSAYELSDVVDMDMLYLKEIADRSQSDQTIVDLLTIIVRLYSQLRDLKDDDISEEEMAEARAKYGCD